MKTLLAIAASLLSITALAQQPQQAFLTNSLAWDPSPSPDISVYLVSLTTNKVHFGTNGYTIPASALITTHTTPLTSVPLTNLWPNITNGVYSVFVQARSTAGIDSITSSNLVFRMNIPLLPVRGLHLQ